MADESLLVFGRYVHGTGACFFFVVLIVAAIGGIGLISFLIFLIGFGSIFAITFFGVWYAVVNPSIFARKIFAKNRKARSKMHIGSSLSDLIFLIGFGSIFAITFFGVWYAVEGNELSVYQFCRPHRFPINKIKAIKSCKSFLCLLLLYHAKLYFLF